MTSFESLEFSTILDQNMMMEAHCRKKLQAFSVAAPLQQSFMLFICVLNLFFSVVATLANLLVIYALWKASSIPANLRKLLISLAFSDLSMGLFVQPMFAVIIAVMIKMVADENYDFDGFCPSVFTIAMGSAAFFVGATFFTIAAIALDRYLALILHLRYQELVTNKRVNIALVILWLASGIGTFIFLTLPSHNDMVAVVFESLGLVLITVAYIRIYKIIRYHKNQIQNQSQVHNNEAIQAARVKKSALNSFYVYVILLVCYFPNLLASVLLEAGDLRMPTLVAYFSSIFLLCLSSSLNPLVYCWRYREVRQMVRSTVEKVFVNNQPL